MLSYWYFWFIENCVLNNEVCSDVYKSLPERSLLVPFLQLCMMISGSSGALIQMQKLCMEKMVKWYGTQTSPSRRVWTHCLRLLTPSLSLAFMNLVWQIETSAEETWLWWERFIKTFTWTKVGEKWIRCITDIMVLLKPQRNGGTEWWQVCLSTDAPHSTIYTQDDVELGMENTLICHVTGFYPAPVTVWWTRNGENVTEGVSISPPYPNKDFTFNQVSSLTFTPGEGDIYSCSVQHMSLTEPLTRIWGETRCNKYRLPAVW